MKKYNVIAGMIFSMFTIQTHAQTKPSFAISAKLDDLPDNTPVYLLAGPDGEEGVLAHTDTVARTRSGNGTFSFSGSMPVGPRFYTIAIRSHKVRTILLDRSNRVNIEGNINHWPDSVNVQGAPYEDERRAFEKESLKHRNGGTNGLFAWVKQTLSTRMGSGYTPYVIRYLDIKDKIYLYHQLLPAARASYYGRQLAEQIRKDSIILATRNGRTSLRDGDPMLDFVSLTPDGRPMSVKALALKNKLTLLDFWASWCGPCRAEIPNIKKVYEAYKDKGLGIVGISLDKDAKPWKNAIEKMGLSWPQLSQLKGFDELGVKLYGITGIPSYLLVDAKGNILAMSLNSGFGNDHDNLHGEGLQKIVAEQFQQK